MPYLPFDQRCILIPSAGTNDPVGSQQAQQAIVELQQMVVRAQAAADSFINRTPWDFASLGINLMKDVQRSTGGGSSPGGTSAPGWASRFVAGPGGHTYFWPSNPRWNPPGGGSGGAGTVGASGPCSAPSGCGENPCGGDDYDAADVVASDELPGIASLGAPPLPSMTTQQGVSVPMLRPPTGPVAIARGSGVGEWTPSVAQPGTVPADCLAAQRSNIPWWLWLLGGIAVVAAVSDEKQTRRSSGQKRAA